MIEQDNPSVPTVIVEAWKEALAEKGLKRVILVFVLASATILFLPLWGLLWVLQMAGFFHAEGGFQIP